MTDTEQADALVERLRGVNPLHRGVWLVEVTHAAADEIERLRGMVNRLSSPGVLEAGSITNRPAGASTGSSAPDDREALQRRADALRAEQVEALIEAELLDQGHQESHTGSEYGEGLVERWTYSAPATANWLARKITAKIARLAPPVVVAPSDVEGPEALLVDGEHEYALNADGPPEGGGWEPDPTVEYGWMRRLAPAVEFKSRAAASAPVDGRSNESDLPDGPSTLSNGPEGLVERIALSVEALPLRPWDENDADSAEARSARAYGSGIVASAAAVRSFATRDQSSKNDWSAEASALKPPPGTSERVASGLPESQWADENRAAGLDYDDLDLSGDADG